MIYYLSSLTSKNGIVHRFHSILTEHDSTREHAEVALKKMEAEGVDRYIVEYEGFYWAFRLKSLPGGGEFNNTPFERQ